MSLKNTFLTTILFLGDIVVFAVSLWLMLLLRYQGNFEAALIDEHFSAFIPLFAVWLLIFFMAGLYGKRIVLFKSSVLRAIIQTQLFNILLAALFFFTVPVGIAPKTNLVLYLIISLSLIVFWRFVLFAYISRPRHREAALFIGEGEDMHELAKEVNSNERYPFVATEVVSVSEAQSRVTEFQTLAPEYVVVMGSSQEAYVCANEILGAQKNGVVEFEDLYEEVFERVPLSVLQNEWFTQYASTQESMLYGVCKRLIDIVGGILMALATLILTPLIALLMRFEGPGPVFISQERYGKQGRIVRSYKFRSMRQNKSASGEWVVEETKDNPVTKLGSFLRRTSLDEFPQCLNVLSGELSLIGPRNDIIGLGKRLGEALPYYHMRYTVTPGITGWAQINQQYEQGHFSPQSVEETKVRLAYDFYYIKNRSLALDIVIALKTFKRMLFRVSSW